MMKNKAFAKIICLLLSLTMLFNLSGCNNEDKKPIDNTKYQITVIGGSGSGEYTKGTECTIVAEIPNDKKFDNWTVDETVVSAESTYKFKVEKEQKIVANFSEKFANVSVIGGGLINSTTENEAKLNKGEKVSIFADENQNKVFKYFTVNGKEDQHITENPYEFILESDTTIKTIYDKICLIAVNDGNVVGETNLFKAGETCTIETADSDPSGMGFAYWYSLDAQNKEVVLSRELSYSFTVSETMCVYAKRGYKCNITVVNGYIKGTTNTTGSYLEGEICTVVSNPPSEDKALGKWTINDETVSKQAEYTFKVATNSLTITAHYVDIAKLATLANEKNQVFNWYLPAGSKVNPEAAEFLRYNKVSVFTEGVDYVMYYIYTSNTADKKDYVGRFKIYNGTGGDRLETLDGKITAKYDGGGVDACIQGANVVNQFYPLIAAAVGESYSTNQDYYFAAQLIARTDMAYTSGEISQIGSVIYNQAAIKNRG